MLARLQQTALILALALAAAWTWAWWHSSPALALIGLLVTLLGWTVTIAIELLLLAAIRSQDPTPRASIGQLIRAWFKECVAVAKVFGWWQPFRSDRWPNPKPKSDWKGRRGVVLIHGFVCNRGVWTPWMEQLTRTGTPFAAINLEPVFSPIEDYAPIIGRAVRDLTEATGLPPVVVAHSMGGLAVRAWLTADPNASNAMHHCVTLASPHHGTWLAYLGRPINVRQMRINSDWLKHPRMEPEARMAKQFTCWYTNGDNVVMPPATATLPGADNRLAPSLGHVSLVLDQHIMNSTLDLVSSVTGEPITDHGASDRAQCSQKVP